MVQLINFAIFFAALNVVFLRPVAAAIRRRREYINSLVSDYDRYQAEGGELRAQAEAIRAQARREAENLLSVARAEGSNEAAAIAAQYAARSQATIEESQRTARVELEAARPGEGAAARAVADVMLARVLPEAAP
ncbi:MAG: ATP synthase F0 subunit B [Candidatus Eremiobacteraeota bacterium]|nr:ATP synthase F0 subunit B [Candidatus Eremiobacteraeota bacterium]